MVSMRQSVNGDFTKKETEAVMNVTDFIRKQIAAAKLSRLSYEGPFVACHFSGRGKDNFMPRIGNSSHNANTNNGYARKQSGGFYCH